MVPPEKRPRLLRGDCENNFDEYKNQYGWGGFVTKDLKPCRAIARLIAIVANWWNIFCRLADGDRHLEPTTSRPMYMGIVGRYLRRYIHPKLLFLGMFG